MLQVYILKPAQLIDSWSEITDRGKYALYTNPSRPVIITGFDEHWSIGHLVWHKISATKTSSFWTYVKTPETKQAKNWRTLTAVHRYIEKQMRDYWTTTDEIVTEWD